jgi:type II secretory pathway component GspD/PulD (secretin)
MRTTVGISILLATIAFTSIVHAQTNAQTDQPAATNTATTDNDQFIPLIRIKDAPITALIETLARRAGINYIIDPKLFPRTDSNGNVIPEPLMAFSLRNISAKDCLNRILNVRGLALVEDPVTTVARVTRINQATNFVDASLLGMDTNNPAADTNDIPTEIRLQDVPLDAALKAFIKASSLQVGLDPQISAGDVILSARWTHITPKQAIITLCQNYDLVIVKDAATGVIEIKPKSDAENK